MDFHKVGFSYKNFFAELATVRKEIFYSLESDLYSFIYRKVFFHLKGSIVCALKYVDYLSIMSYVDITLTDISQQLKYPNFISLSQAILVHLKALKSQA